MTHRDEARLSLSAPAQRATSVGADIFARAINWFEKYVLGLVIGGFVAGIAVASVSQPVIDQVDAIINVFMDLYDLVAPMAIFLILTPSLARLFSNRKTGTFGLLTINWFALRKLLASLWAIVFVLAVFRIPILPQGSLSLGNAIQQTTISLGDMMLTSTYFWAMYAAIAVSVISIKVDRLTRALEKVMDTVEVAGSYFLPLMPVFMFGIGAYVYGLPGNVQEQIGLDETGTSVLLDLNIWGWTTSPRSSSGMIVIYVLGAVLTGVACFIWQFAFIILTWRLEPRFSIVRYFTEYWVRVYPLLWATSSEALATPLQLYLAKKYAPWVRSEVRRFTIGVGSYMDINGTIINVFLLGTIVLLILGLNVSVVELLFIVPVVFLISYGVPGIPGELVLFAGPIATMLNIPEASLPVFLAVYLGIQLGLPDSFRTGSNSTDDYIQAILLNAVYEKRYASDEDALAVVPASPDATPGT
jgi:Na+/H+-dicarboxylate symporter